jgi:hypothetical protein
MRVKWRKEWRDFRDGIRELKLTRFQKTYLALQGALFLYSVGVTGLMIIHRIFYGNWGVEAFINYLERHGTKAIVIFVLGSILIGCLRTFLREVIKLKKAEDLRYEELFYKTITSLAIGILVAIVGFFILRHSPRVFWYWNHKQYLSLWLQCDLVLCLILLGVVVYRFKKKSKLLYGVSEIAIAITSNLALISRVDVLHLQQAPPSIQTVIAIGAFTYLLSQGIGNVAEGLGEIDKKRLAQLSTTAEIISS